MNFDDVIRVLLTAAAVLIILSVAVMTGIVAAVTVR